MYHQYSNYNYNIIYIYIYKKPVKRAVIWFNYTNRKLNVAFYDNDSQTYVYN